MFIGGLVMGIALEHSNLHRRLALKIIIFFGSSYKKYVAVFIFMFFILFVSKLQLDGRHHVGDNVSVNGKIFFKKFKNLIKIIFSGLTTLPRLPWWFQ